MFLKYPSLTNHYNSKDISYLQKVYGDKALNCDWILTEKIHGSNISFLFGANYPTVKVFSRNNEITGSNFYSADDVINNFINKIDKVIAWAKNKRLDVRIFGELFGEGIQKGVKYGPKQIRIFDIMINDEFLTQKNVENLLYDFKLGHIFVPKIGVFSSFKEAMELNEIFPSLILTEDGNEAEGFVIKPYNVVMKNENQSIFYIKKKNPKFQEKNKVKKSKPSKKYSEKVNELKDVYKSYINKNRLESVFSKEGEISSSKEIGKFIALVQQDAMEDFKKEQDFIEDDFTKDEKKYIFNQSKEIVELLREYM